MKNIIGLSGPGCVVTFCALSPGKTTLWKRIYLYTATRHVSLTPEIEFWMYFIMNTALAAPGPRTDEPRGATLRIPCPENFPRDTIALNACFRGKRKFRVNFRLYTYLHIYKTTV